MNRSSFIRLSSFFALILVALTLSQCKKSSSNPGGSGNSGGYYLKFTLNGQAVEYDSEPSAEITTKVNSDGLYTATLVAYKNFDLSSENELLITVLSTSPIADNVAYDDPQKATEPNGSQVPEATVFWADSTGTGYLTVGSLADANGNIPIAGMVANAKLTITELTSTDLKGTFSGTVYNAGNFSISDNIANGTFYLKRTQ